MIEAKALPPRNERGKNVYAESGMRVGKVGKEGFNDLFGFFFSTSSPLFGPCLRLSGRRIRGFGNSNVK